MGNQDIIQTDKFLKCQFCNKKLIKRQSNGLFHFRYGWQDGRRGVELLIHGSIRMRCLDPKCGKWNLLTFLPNDDTNEEQFPREKSTQKE